MKPPFNWPALIVLAVVIVLGWIGLQAITTAIPATSHDIVLAIVSGLVGALSMKAAENAISTQGSAVQAPPAAPATQTPATPPEAPAPAPEPGQG